MCVCVCVNNVNQLILNEEFEFKYVYKLEIL